MTRYKQDYVMPSNNNLFLVDALMNATARECCKKLPFYLEPVSRRPYCRECFPRLIESRVRKALRKYRMIQQGDHIAVGVSGGKDSLVLLDMLRRIVPKIKNAKITAITVDEGIEGYRDESIEIAKEMAKKWNVPHVITSYKELFGYDLDEIVKEAKKLEITLAPCGFCGPLRRTALNVLARKINATKLAVGHNLDDEAQTILMNVLRGDDRRFIRYQRDVEGQQLTKKGFIPRIRPLVYVSEPEIVLHAMLLGITYHQTPCVYAPQAFRNKVRNFLNELEHAHPGTMHGIVQFHDRLLNQIMNKNHAKDDETLISMKSMIPLTTCNSCGEPSNGPLCNACKVLNLVGFLDVKKQVRT